jgi:hypothetical protein
MAHARLSIFGVIAGSRSHPSRAHVTKLDPSIRNSVNHHQVTRRPANSHGAPGVGVSVCGGLTDWFSVEACGQMSPGSACDRTGSSLTALPYGIMSPAVAPILSFLRSGLGLRMRGISERSRMCPRP